MGKVFHLKEKQWEEIKPASPGLPKHVVVAPRIMRKEDEIRIREFLIPFIVGIAITTFLLFSGLLKKEATHDRGRLEGNRAATR